MIKSSFTSEMRWGAAWILIQRSPFCGTKISAGAGLLPVSSSCLATSSKQSATSLH